MVGTSYSTPLVGLDAVVLDTETGLDARTARVVQIGAVRMHGPELLSHERFERLVNPGVPIPHETIAVHGIAEADVAHAAPFSAVLPEFEEFLGASIVIGHTIAYDMDVLRREYEVAGEVWRHPRALDVRILAKLAAPTLAPQPGPPLRLAEDRDRCPAYGDRRRGGDRPRLLAALLPLLRQRNIRTLAEAEAPRVCSPSRRHARRAVSSASPPAPPPRRAPARAHRQLSLSPPPARGDERAARVPGCRREPVDCAAYPDGPRRQLRFRAQCGRGDRHPHRARRARARHARRQGARPSGAGREHAGAVGIEDAFVYRAAAWTGSASAISPSATRRTRSLARSPVATCCASAPPPRSCSATRSTARRTRRCSAPHGPSFRTWRKACSRRASTRAPSRR